MKARDFQARRLDVAAFAAEAGELQGRMDLSDLPRWSDRLHPDGEVAQSGVQWRARGESRPRRGAADEIWLHLQAQARLPLTCQRCLGPVPVAFEVDRWFRFASDEASAAALDEASEDDVLSLDHALDLHELVEDELLLDAPLVPRHERCPRPLPSGTASITAEAGAPPAQAPAGETTANPFAALAGLKGRLRRGDTDDSEPSGA